MGRIAVARLWHEGNSFTPVRTRLADFRRREWHTGPAVAGFYAGSRTELGAAVDFFDEDRSLTPIWLRCAAAGPGGPVEEADLQVILAEIVDGVHAAKPDAMYLSLHGALLGSETLMADLALLKRVRRALGNRYLAVSFDLHANLDPSIADLADVVVGYKTYPHVDMYETGLKALRLLRQAWNNETKPVVRIAKAGALLPSFKMRTADGPMAEIEALAAMETRRHILDVTPFGGFAYGDTPCNGASVAVTTHADRATAKALAHEIAKQMYERRGRFAVHLPSPAQVFGDLQSRERPAAILEPSDNPLSGGIGDTTGLFRALVESGREAVFAFFWDPELVRKGYHWMMAGGLSDEVLTWVHTGGRYPGREARRAVFEEHLDALIARTPAEQQVWLIRVAGWNICDAEGRAWLERVYRARAAKIPNGAETYKERLAEIDQCIAVAPLHQPGLGAWLKGR